MTNPQVSESQPIEAEYHITLYVRTYFAYPTYPALYTSLDHICIFLDELRSPHTSLHSSSALSISTHPTKPLRPHNQLDLRVHHDSLLMNIYPTCCRSSAWFSERVTLPPAAESFSVGWQEAPAGQTKPVSELCGGIDAE